MNDRPETPQDAPHERPIEELPSARPLDDHLRARLRDPFAVFLDYDGTLTPIVDDPDDARIPERTRATIEALAEVTLVAVVSGRDLDDVRAMVGVDGLAYAGSHGFDIRHADGRQQQVATGYLDALDRAHEELERQLADIPGARIERKRFAIAVHDRAVDDPELRDRIDQIVAGLASHETQLRATGGKRIHELRPDLDWDKGRAIETLLDELGAEGRVPLYLGDDLTDEDGFRAVKARGGVAIVVRGEDADRMTFADAALETTDEAERFLDELRELATEQAAG
jgi:trehalose 6-phosphate phosphatase